MATPVIFLMKANTYLSNKQTVSIGNLGAPKLQLFDRYFCDSKGYLETQSGLNTLDGDDLNQLQMCIDI